MLLRRVDEFERLLQLKIVQNKHYAVPCGYSLIDNTLQELDIFKQACEGQLAMLLQNEKAKAKAKAKAKEDPVIEKDSTPSLEERLEKASEVYGFFKAGYKDPETRKAKETIKNQQLAKDNYKRLLAKPKLLDDYEKGKAERRLEKLKTPEQYFSVKK